MRCGSAEDGTTHQTIFQWGLDASAARGLDARVVPSLGKQLAEAGARHVGKKVVDIPIGDWGGRIGRMMKQDLLNVFGGLKALYTERGAANEDFAALLDLLPGEWETFHSALRFFLFDGQK
jgi:hypothetical protein